MVEKSLNPKKKGRQKHKRALYREPLQMNLKGQPQVRDGTRHGTRTKTSLRTLKGWVTVRELSVVYQRAGTSVLQEKEKV